MKKTTQNAIKHPAEGGKSMVFIWPDGLSCNSQVSEKTAS